MNQCDAYPFINALFSGVFFLNITLFDNTNNCHVETFSYFL